MINIENSNVFSLSDDTNGLGSLNRRKSGCLTCTVLPLSSIKSNGRKGACSTGIFDCNGFHFDCSRFKV